MAKYYLLFLFCYNVFYTTNSFSQTKSIIVLNKYADKNISNFTFFLNQIQIEPNSYSDSNFIFNTFSDTINLYIKHKLFGEYQKKIILSNENLRYINLEFNNKIKQINNVNIKNKKNIYEKNQTQAGQSDIENAETHVNVSGNIENSLKFQALGVSNNSEIGSQYNVRGGNFDENIVYVNDYYIYRPLLLRSAQQEGLSFVNSSLTEDIKFYSGGFKSQFGDKISSVLDVKYKVPKRNALSVELSTLGANISLEKRFNDNIAYVGGFRYRNNSYLLSSQQTKGQYNPLFIDYQHSFKYFFSKKIHFDWFLNTNRNEFSIFPEDRTTNFGLSTYSLTYKVYYNGEEKDIYNNLMNGLGINIYPTQNIKIRLSNSYNKINETQNFDITGNYSFGEIETDINSSNFQQLKSILGSGIMQNWGRDFYKADISTNQINIDYIYNNINIKSGFSISNEKVELRNNEWERLDSSGFTLSSDPNQIQLQNYLNFKYFLNSNRIEYFLQSDFIFNINKISEIGLNLGSRVNYWSLNKELNISPRFQAYIKPNTSKNYSFNLAVGLYKQPPFLKELIDPIGNLNLNTKAQKSIHYILGFDYILKMFDRPFKLTTEIYYKHLWDVNTYSYNNILVKYKANNNTIAFAKGIDFRLQGEIVKDAESWVNLSLMQTKENTFETFIKYIDSNNNVSYIPHDDIVIVDTIKYQRGYFSRQNDQLFNFNLFYQDYFANLSNFKVHLNFVYASGLPFSTPNIEALRNSFSMSTYKRIDIGFSALLHDSKKSNSKSKFLKNIKSIWTTLEFFNFLDFKNQVSVSWLKDYASNQYAIPNNLTGRRINLRTIIKF